ncbi:MAG: polysaccharide pyruvyl transferase family protein [Oscillospiraceae bacterium]
MGDETILEAILQQLARDADMPICVMSKTPGQTAKKMNVSSIYTFSHGKTNRRMKHAKLFISGGGSLIQDATSTRSLWFYLYSIWAAHRQKCRVMMYGCGIGPVRKKLNRRLSRRSLKRLCRLLRCETRTLPGSWKAWA